MVDDKTGKRDRLPRSWPKRLFTPARVILRGVTYEVDPRSGAPQVYRMEEQVKVTTRRVRVSAEEANEVLTKGSRL